MYNNNMYNQNQFGQYPYMSEPRFVCPFMQTSYGQQEPTYDNFYRTEDDGNFVFDEFDQLDEFEDVFNTEDRALNITDEHIENVAANVMKEATNIFKDIQKFIKDTKLVEYLLVCLVTYICRNYYKYKDVIEEKTDELVDEIKRNLPWVFDILALFNVTPAMVDDFLDNLIKVTVMNLRKLIPSA